ncbi:MULTISPECIES: hypothetical protein [unclassified Pseudofrankia]|uniref:hypothetical protein n=1 Tax=unclassified Pseudofrankia TaxID=2994372 RepID=UPI0010427593|nr:MULTISPECIES: hypothetical protein [unclassified Pseudofrankia]MDT3445419.1 hypothetical protein [Pseudofrankia sp. BMG5.37]
METQTYLEPMPYGWPKVAVTVADVDAAHDELIQRAFPAFGPPSTTGKSTITIGLDPHGTPIRLHHLFGGQGRVADLFDDAEGVVA